jgi:hypothetical protein
VIQQEGEQSLFIYWIIKGECLVDRIVPFVSNKQKLGKNLRAFVPGEVLGTGDELVNLKLTTEELTKDACFPTIPFIGENSSTMRYFGQESLKKSFYTDFYSRMSPSDDRTWLRCSVRASSKVIIGSMNMIDFVRIAPKEVIFELCLKPSIQDYSIQELQKQYLEEQRWVEVKKEIIQQVGLS